MKILKKYLVISSIILGVSENVYGASASPDALPEPGGEYFIKNYHGKVINVVAGTAGYCDVSSELDEKRWNFHRLFTVLPDSDDYFYIQNIQYGHVLGVVPTTNVVLACPHNGEYRTLRIFKFIPAEEKGYFYIEHMATRKNLTITDRIGIGGVTAAANDYPDKRSQWFRFDPSPKFSWIITKFDEERRFAQNMYDDLLKKHISSESTHACTLARQDEAIAGMLRRIVALEERATRAEAAAEAASRENKELLRAVIHRERSSSPYAISGGGAARSTSRSRGTEARTDAEQ